MKITTQFLLSFAIIVMANLSLSAQTKLSIVPEPVETKLGNGTNFIDKKTTIFYSNKLFAHDAKMLSDYIKEFYGISLKTKSIDLKKSKLEKNSILFQLKNIKQNEGYQLESNSTGISISASTPNGAFYGIQTLLQTISQNIKNLSVPFYSINDYPRFKYRGMHLDVSRHFFTIDFVKKYIEYLAYHKLNNFHWHLTDDQGWRIEIKKYPRLTEVGGCRAQTLVGRFGSDQFDGKKYCGYYTQKQIKEVIKYAQDRMINVIPEIEMPGHAVAALASYPYLGCTKGPYKTYETWGVAEDVFCAGNDSTYKFLEGVLDEVVALFPSKYIHIGGDECPKIRWKKCPVCQAKIKKEGLKDEHELQSYFVQRMEKYLNKKGKRIIGWDEILEGGLAPNATVMSWRGEAGGIEAAKQNHDVIMTPGDWCYFDKSQSRNEDSLTIGGYIPLEKVYSFEPIPASLTEAQSKYILGAQANMWNEYSTNPKKVEYQLLPRLSALSEVIWSPKEKKNWNAFEQKLPEIFARYKIWGANFSNAYYDVQTQVKPSNKTNTVIWELTKRDDNYKVNAKMILGNKVNVPVYDQNGNLIGFKAMLDSVDVGDLGEFGPKNNKIEINETGEYRLDVSILDPKTGAVAQFFPEKIKQQFFINKATNKKIVLKNEPDKMYQGLSGFTLVDGVQNNKGMSKSAQFLGFIGYDLDATIDLDSNQDIKLIRLHLFEQAESWIQPAESVQFYISNDGINFTEVANIFDGKGKRNYTIEKELNASARFIKVVAKNFGKIPEGLPGAGYKAWLFVDEIEVF